MMTGMQGPCWRLLASLKGLAMKVMAFGTTDSWPLGFIWASWDEIQK
jgi:hypothetical protein